MVDWLYDACVPWGRWANELAWTWTLLLSLSYLFVYDKLSEDVWKVNVWIAHPYLIDLLHSPAPSDQRGAAGWLAAGGDTEGTAASNVSWLFPDILAEAGYLGRNQFNLLLFFSLVEPCVESPENPSEGSVSPLGTPLPQIWYFSRVVVTTIL